MRLVVEEASLANSLLFCTFFLTFGLITFSQNLWNNKALKLQIVSGGTL